MKTPFNKLWFTLVELIVVITILVVLGTIAFINLWGFSAFTRDSARIENISNLKKWLDIFRIRAGTYPSPELSTPISISWGVVAFQWFAKQQIEGLSKVSPWAAVDPKDSVIYTTYSTANEGKNMQLMAFMEDKNSVPSATTLATSVTSTNIYSKRYPYTIGDKIWILLSSGTSSPVQETATGNIDLTTTATGYAVYFDNNTQNFWTGTVLSAAFLTGSIVYASTLICNAWENGSSGVCKDPYWGNVGLLMHMNGTNGGTSFVDEKLHSVTINNSVTTSTTQSKIGSASSYFPNQRFAYLSVGSPGDYDINGTDFTIEAWVYFNGLGSRYANQSICATHDTIGNDSGWSFSVGDNGTTINNIGMGLSRTAGAPGIGLTVATSISLNSWHHIAVSHKNSPDQLMFFLDGMQQGSTQALGGFADQVNSVNLKVGTSEPIESAWDTQFNGYIDELRITKWVTRYSSNFTPPTIAFPNN